MNLYNFQLFEAISLRKSPGTHTHDDCQVPAADLPNFRASPDVRILFCDSAGLCLSWDSDSLSVQQ